MRTPLAARGEDLFADLYPAASARMRVVERLPIPGLGVRYAQEPLIRDRDDAYLERTLAEIDVVTEPRERLALIDKAVPHGVFDLMVLASDPGAPASIAELQPHTVGVLLALAHAYVEYLSSEAAVSRFGLTRGHFHLCFNHDPDTLDRESGMADKRFHLHLNYWSSRIELASWQVGRFGDLSSISWRRRLLDPIAFLGPRVAFELMGGHADGWAFMTPDDERDAARGLPAGLKIELPGWDVLSSSSFTGLLPGLHRGLRHAYDLVHHAFTGRITPPAPWTRHALLAPNRVARNLEAIRELSDQTRGQLLALANALRDLDPRTLERLRSHRSRRVRHLALAGMNYSIGLYAQAPNRPSTPLIRARPVYLVVQPKLFADIGGAGVTYIGDVPIVRLERGGSLLSPRAQAERRAFQQDAVRWLRSRVDERVGARWLSR